MKTIALTFAAVCLVFCGRAVRADQEGAHRFERHFAVKLAGGINRLGSGDWNAFLNAHKNGPWWLANLQMAAMPKDDYRSYLRWARGGEIEINYVFHPNYRIAIGTERFQGTGKFGYRMILDTGEPLHDLSEPLVLEEVRHEMVRATINPVYLTFYINDKSYPNKPYIGLGVGYYSASYNSETDLDMAANFYVDPANISSSSGLHFVDQDSSLVSTSRMKAAGVGFHAVLGTEYFLSKGLAVIAEIKGRYAKISGFTGSKKYSIDGGETVSERGELTALSEYPPGTYIHHVVELDTRAESANQRTITPNGQARPAVMDFSGVSLRLGLTYHF